MAFYFVQGNSHMWYFDLQKVNNPSMHSFYWLGLLQLSGDSQHCKFPPWACHGPRHHCLQVIITNSVNTLHPFATTFIIKIILFCHRCLQAVQCQPRQCGDSDCCFFRWWLDRPRKKRWIDRILTESNFLKSENRRPDNPRAIIMDGKSSLARSGQGE